MAPPEDFEGYWQPECTRPNSLNVRVVVLFLPHDRVDIIQIPFTGNDRIPSRGLSFLTLAPRACAAEHSARRCGVSKVYHTILSAIVSTLQREEFMALQRGCSGVAERPRVKRGGARIGPNM